MNFLTVSLHFRHVACLLQLMLTKKVMKNSLVGVSMVAGKVEIA